ncbi:uncharacterized protein [Dermacentor andersoni]|uniref:uncharacterized protein n=1 Tax=Dermacentor andersoni TaxID=34620 RepID=UPI003B39FC52
MAAQFGGARRVDWYWSNRRRCRRLFVQNGHEFQKATWSEEETKTLIRLWEEHLSDLRAKRNIKVYDAIRQKLEESGFKKTTKEVKKKMENLGNKYRLIKRKETGTGPGTIAWPYYWDLHRFLASLPLHDDSLAQESSCTEHFSPAQEVLNGNVRCEVDEPGSAVDECSPPLSMATPSPSSSSGAHSSLPSVPSLALPIPSCEDDSHHQKETVATKRKRLPATNTLLTQLLEEQRQLRLSMESRRDRELKLKEEQLKLLQKFSQTDDKLLAILSDMAKK